MGFIQHLVWEVTRNNPVQIGATLNLGSDGNLVLADVDGRVVWQTNTPNKGVTGIKLLENGNLVLHNAKDKFLWQSFDHPTDTLLPGQSVRVGLRHKLVSRASPGSSLDGPYNLIVSPNDMSIFYKTQNKHTQNFIPYYTLPSINQGSTLKQVQFVVNTLNQFSSTLSVDFILQNGNYTGPIYTLTKTRYNSTLSFLRLDYDGNLRIYAYNDNASIKLGMFNFWTIDLDEVHESECQLPEKCGEFGVCDKD
ncbi:hypothetical protein RND81_12G217400 [Saponaria officinalis]|uniref:Bulb-type lectin domain-containing protein n=1 Tax=Saponaria officinalis TaxID=3572 RepID=A0AAW1HDM8_SAPOF